LIDLARYHHRTTRGQPLSFRDRPYLIEPYADFPGLTEASVVKAPQTGWSELFIQLALERSGWKGRTVGYVLPTYTLRNRFVHTRIDPVLARVPAYRARLPGGLHPPGVGKDGRPQQKKPRQAGFRGASSLQTKAFGLGTILFLGANTPGDFVEFSADCMIIDELDLCQKGGHLALAYDRLRASPNPQIFRCGNPTIPSYGIEATYSKSDRRLWHHRCSRCNEWQPIDWFSQVVAQDDAGRWVLRDRQRRASGIVRPICRKCGRPFDRGTSPGCWVDEYQSIDRRGYRLSQLDVLSMPVRPLFREWLEAQGNTAALVAFYASVLGRAYEPAGRRVDRELIANAATGDPMQPGGGEEFEPLSVAMGVDVGSVLNFSVSIAKGRKRNGRFFGAVRSFDEIYRIAKRFHVKCLCIDSRPETRAAQQLRDRIHDDPDMECEVWLVQFHATDRAGKEAYGLRVDRKRGLLTVDRTQLLDATLDDLRASPPRRILPSDIGTVEHFAAQMRAPVRRLSDRGDRYVWDEGGQPDHYRLTDAYERVAADMLGRGGSYFVLDLDPEDDEDDEEDSSDW